jgi:hypothetical protein
MQKLFVVASAAVIIASISVAPASAKQRKQHIRHHMSSGQSSGTVGSAPMRGNNAELMGNSGNSGQGSNSLGNIQGGNVGGGK